MPKTMELFGQTETKIAKDKNGENVPHLEITEVALFHCNIINNTYHHNLRVLYTSISNKPCAQLLFLKSFNSECSYLQVWFTDKNPKLLEIEDKINITLVIN